MRTRLTTLLLLLAALALLVPGSAVAAKRPKLPAITFVSPMRLNVGDRIIVRGRNFSPRPRQNTIIFRAPSGRTAFAKPIRASRTRLVVRVPGSVARLLTRRSGRAVPTRFRMRVLTRRFGRFTIRRLSPVILPIGSPTGLGGGGGGGGVPAPGVCGTGSDYDGDLLENGFEVSLGLDPCLKDTDLDAVEDGYEYKSAIDLNNDDYQEPNQSLPYPAKRPYPNPLDSSDGAVDYDGDSLRMVVEQRLWKFSTTAGNRTLFPLSYSDGLQHSVYTNGPGDRRQPALAAAGYSKQSEFVQWAQDNGYRNVYIPFRDDVHGLFDFDLNGAEAPQEGLHYDIDGNGFLSDEERDEDADGLMNWDEDNGRTMGPLWWSACYEDETAYYVAYAGTNLTDSDSDGDGVRDGADDQDHDDLPNVMELSRIAASHHDDREPGKTCVLSEVIRDALENDDPPKHWHENAYGQVQPFNPCLPVTSSRTCNRVPAFGAAWAPFDDSPDWFSLN